ncbi:hypothetical protein ABFX02_04G123700 [Erythranthe guttata]
MADLPIINLPLLHRDPLAKSSVIKKIRDACHRYGFFHVVDHGIPDRVIEDALKVSGEFFELPMAEKEELASDDVCKEVRFCKLEMGEFARDFLKLYANPLDHFLASWPRSPPYYREKMGIYSKEVRKLSIELFGAIMESLKLDNQTNHLQKKFEQGLQTLVLNSYAPCSESDKKIGAPPHTDHSIITVLLQSAPGLEIDNGETWKNVPNLKGSLQVLVGVHLEVISNGFYKSVLHRAIPSFGDSTTRLSIASLHNLAIDEVVEPAAELAIDSEDGSSRMYKGSSLRDYLKHLASGEKRGFIETIKIN